MDIKIIDTPEKFQSLAEEIVPPLLELLQARNALEAEIFARSRELETAKRAAGIPESQTAPGSEELWEEFRRRYLELVESWCVPGLLKYGAVRSCGKPARYDPLFEDPEGQVIFTMKSAKKATVVTTCRKSWEYRYRFTLKPVEGGWLIAGIQCCLGGESSWSVEHYV